MAKICAYFSNYKTTNTRKTDAMLASKSRWLLQAIGGVESRNQQRQVVREPFDYL